jgi:hypothetical protein
VTRFGGELVDGEVWGRGAVDMLNLTASMARGHPPPGRLGVPARGHARLPGRGRRGSPGHLGRRPHGPARARRGGGRLRDHRVRAASRCPGGDGALRLPVLVGEKGSAWSTLRITGTPGHASQPYATDNALVTAAQVVQRLAEFRPRDPDPRLLAPVPRRHGVPGRGHRAPCSTPTASTPSPRCPRHGPPVPRLHPHDDRAHRGPRRDQDERHPDCVDVQLDIRTLPGRPWPTCRHCSTRRSATWPAGSRCSRPRRPRDRVPHGHPAVGLAVRHQPVLLRGQPSGAR